MAISDICNCLQWTARLAYAVAVVCFVLGCWTGRVYDRWLAKRRRPPFQSKGEAACGVALQKLFPHRTFANRVRPNWLLNTYSGQTTRPARLELDWYCQEERLAVEYHGRQHSEIVPHFHEHGEKSLWAQKQRDQRKRELCATRGVDLIEIWHDVPLDKIFHVISSHAHCIRRLRGVTPTPAA
jgi:hypothetical protein